MKNITTVAFSLFFFISISLFSQNVNNDYYRFGAKPAEIPMQLNGFNSQGGKVFFGISDPGLDSATSVLQALKRAKALVAMSQGVKVKYYTTGYLTEAYRGNTGTYQSMVELDIKGVNLPVVSVIDTFFTIYNEAIILVQPTGTDSVNGFDFYFNRYNIEYQWGGYAEYSEQLEMNVDDKITVPETLVFMKYGSNEDVYTMVGDESFPLPLARYSYMTPRDSVPQVYRFGLWINILREINIKLGQYSRAFNEQVRKMDEMYQTSDKIDEGVSKNRISFDINNLYFQENQVMVELKVTLLEN